MNRITPLDIQKRKFNIRFKGFDAREVNTFLERLSDEMENLILLNHQLKEDIKKEKREIDEYKKRETILKETLISAQKVINEMKTIAEREAKQLVAEAQIQADKISQDSRKRVSLLLAEIDSLKKQRMRFEAALRSEIDIHTKMLDATNKKEEDLAIHDQKMQFMKRNV